MVDEELKNKMEVAYLNGDKKEALELSQKLDEQVVREQQIINGISGVRNCANFEEGICNAKGKECDQTDKYACDISRELGGYYADIKHRCGNCGNGQDSDTPMKVGCSITKKKEDRRNTCSEWKERKK